MRTIGTLIAIAACACAAYAQQAPGADPLKPRQGQVIGPDDTLTISAAEAEEISKAWRVDEAGEVNLPMVGRIQAAGMTVGEFERSLSERLKKYYRHPQVAVYISEMRSRPITVMGPVEKPGTYQLQGSRTLLDVLALAGGPKETAGSQVTLARLRERGRIDVPGARQDDTGKYDVLELDLKEVMAGHSASSAVPVEAYDVVTVSEFKPQKLVHIAGEVNKPGAVELVSQPDGIADEGAGGGGRADPHLVRGPHHDRALERKGRADLHRVREHEEDHERGGARSGTDVRGYCDCAVEQPDVIRAGRVAFRCQHGDLYFGQVLGGQR